MSTLRVLLLGTPEIRWGEEILPIQRRYPRALLIYLASTGALIGREELLTVFWEDESEKTARLRLRETLSKLRSALPDSNLLLSQDNLIGLDTERVWVDQLNFEKHCNQFWNAAKQIPHQDPLPDNLYKSLKEATELWRGSRFLSGVSLPSTSLLDGWLSRTSQRTEQLRGMVLHRLSDHAFVTGNLEESLRLAQLAIENDELNEGLHERILQILIRLGRRGQAREHFKYVMDVTRRELGQHPSPSLFALFQLTSTSKKYFSIPSTQVLKIKPSTQSPFVGRQAILEQLNKIHKRGGAVFILGESGLGKTRLLQEFIAQLKPKPRLLVAGCRPYETNLPFQPIIDIARNSIRPEEWINIPAPWVTSILPIVPDLADLIPDANKAPEIIPEQGRSVLFEAIRQIIAHIANQQRLIVCIDDAHWADEATLSAIAYLLERPPFLEDAFLIIAARTEHLNANLESLVRFQEERQKGIRLNLPRLKQADIHQLASTILGTSPSNEFTAQLAKETGGNPFFILETLRTLRDRDFSSELSVKASFPLPRNMYLLIRNRLTELSSQARYVLEIAAIIGTEFRPELLAKAGEFSTKEIFQTLMELEQQQLIECITTTAGDLTCRFIHDKIRETLMLEINPVKIRWLHQQVARALEDFLQEDISNHASVLAYHYQAAGEWSRAFDYFIKAGQRARHLLSVEEALQAFRAAEKVLRQPGCHLSDEQIHRLFYERNELKFDTHNTSALQEQNKLLLQIGEERRSPLLVGTALLGLGNACMSSDQFEQGLDYTSRAIQLLDASANLSQRVQAYIDRGVLRYMLSRWSQAKEDFEQALELARDHPEPDIIRARANAHYNIAVILNLEGQPAKAHQHALQAIQGHPIQGQTYRHVPGYSALALAQVFMGEYAQAKDSFQTGIDLAEKTHNWRMLSYLLGNRALYERNIGKLGSSIKSAQKMISIGEQFGHDDIIALGNRLTGDIYYYLQAPDLAEQHYQKGIEIGGETFIAPDILFRLGHVLCQLGQVKLGMNYLQKALKVTKETGLELIHILTQSSLASIFASQGQWERAQRLALNLEKETRRRSLVTLHLRSINLLGEYAFHHNEIDQAISRFETTAKRSALLPNPWIELKSQLMLGRCLQSKGETNTTSQERIAAILAELESSIDEEAEVQVIAQCFEKFRQIILAGSLNI
jgi:DNA-binding SARP family transcriptional activator/tetratricopeptide (TPR) repeat protein